MMAAAVPPCTTADPRSPLLQRWQRRWFVLYDDGELTYSVDDHVSTSDVIESDLT